MPGPASLAPSSSRRWVGIAFGLALCGCSKASDGPPSDGTAEVRLADLERKLSEISQQRDSATLAAGVSSTEALELRKTLTQLAKDHKDVLERLQAMEQALGKAPAATGEPGSTTTPVLTVASAGTLLPSQDGTYSEDQIGNFTKLSEEVQKRKDAAAQAERVRRELTRAGVTLTPEQEASLLKLHSGYSEKMRDLFKNGFGTTDADRQAALDKREALRTQFESELRTVVPLDQADKIVEAMKRGWPGFFPRRMDGTRTPTGGMRDGNN